MGGSQLSSRGVNLRVMRRVAGRRGSGARVSRAAGEEGCGGG
uniref:Uncharacterized protein n=1 Tax=Arundo donax TaxID=35708 RepID=A0A0A9FER7_ARUDO